MINTSKLTPEQMKSLAQAILKHQGYMVLDTVKCNPRLAHNPHKFCYKKWDPEDSIGLIVKWNRIIKVMQFADEEIREKYIAQELGKHTEVKDDEKV